MTLEELDKVDIIVKDKGKTILVIVDAGITVGPEERFSKLLQKLKTYVGVATSEKFKKDYNVTSLENVEIRISYYDTEPTAQMKQITEVGPRGDAENRIAVTHEINEK